MFVHDGLVHKRFPVGPIADVPYFRKVAAAHQVITISVKSLGYVWNSCSLLSIIDYVLSSDRNITKFYTVR